LIFILANFKSCAFYPLCSMLINPVFSDHLSYVTLFQCTLGRSHKTRLTVMSCLYFLFFLEFNLTICKKDTCLKCFKFLKISWNTYYSETCLNQTLSKPKTCLHQTDFYSPIYWTLSKPKTCLHQTDFYSPIYWTLSKPKTCLHQTYVCSPIYRTLSKPKTCLNQTDFYSPIY
jgi:hypothetical protein